MNGVNNNTCALTVFFALTLVLLFFVSPLYSSTDRYALLVQKSPSYGGVVSPDGIVESAGGGEFVKVTAAPRNGYEFVYWLGDVTEPASSVTTVHVDSPKMVIAVFERAELDKPPVTGDGSSIAGGGGGGMIRVPSKIRTPGSVSPATPQPKIPKSPPIVIPEPATIILLGGGMLLLSLRRK